MKHSIVLGALKLARTCTRLLLNNCQSISLHLFGSAANDSITVRMGDAKSLVLAADAAAQVSIWCARTLFRCHLHFVRSKMDSNDRTRGILNLFWSLHTDFRRSLTDSVCGAGDAFGVLFILICTWNLDGFGTGVDRRSTRPFTESFKIRGQLGLKQISSVCAANEHQQREKQWDGNLSRRPFQIEHNLNVIPVPFGWHLCAHTEMVNSCYLFRWFWLSQRVQFCARLIVSEWMRKKWAREQVLCWERERRRRQCTIKAVRTQPKCVEREKKWAGRSETECGRAISVDNKSR